MAIPLTRTPDGVGTLVAGAAITKAWLAIKRIAMPILMVNAAFTFTATTQLAASLRGTARPGKISGLSALAPPPPLC